MSPGRRIVIAAGGTGGHFYPGLVLAQTLRARSWQPLMLVRRSDAALPTLEREAIPYAEIDLSGMPRRPDPALLSFVWKLAKSQRLISRILADFRPALVAGMGGYLSFPAVLAAALKGIPRAVHESNSVLGLANRLCLGLGTRLFWGLPPSPGQPEAEVTGTPIRPALWPGADASTSACRGALGLDPERPTVLVFGGSQGARSLNLQVPGALVEAGAAAQVLHLSGAKAEAETRAAYAEANFPVKVLPYLDQMERAYGAADLVICRSGASTLAELAAQGKPAILIPYPTAAAGHQEANARLFETRGAAAVVLESEIPLRLAACLKDLLMSDQSQARRRSMIEACREIPLPPAREAAHRLADALESLA